MRAEVSFAGWCFNLECRLHRTLGVTPAMAAGVTDRIIKMADAVAPIDAAVPAQLRAHTGSDRLWKALGKFKLRHYPPPFTANG